MTIALILSDEELKGLTGKQRRQAQARTLSLLGIEFKVRADGFPVVLRSHLEQVLGGQQEKPTRQKKKTTPNWSALDAA